MLSFNKPLFLNVKYIIFVISILIVSASLGFAKDDARAKSESLIVKKLNDYETHSFLTADGMKMEINLRRSNIADSRDKAIKIVAKPSDKSNLLTAKNTIPPHFRIIEDKIYDISAEDTDIKSEKLSFSLEFEYPRWLKSEHAQRLTIFALMDDKWIRLPSQIDASAHIVKAENLTTFGVYGLFAAPALASQDIIAYPNPIQFGEFGGETKTLKFINVPLGSVIEIYTLSGEKIKEMNKANKTEIQWDGKKDNGDLVTSGLYLYRVRVPGKDIYGKIAVLQ